MAELGEGLEGRTVEEGSAEGVSGGHCRIDYGV